MIGNGTLMLAAFAAASSLLVLLVVLFSGRNRRVEGRLSTLSEKTRLPSSPAQPTVAQFTKSISKIGKPLMPGGEAARTRLTSRLLHAGIYARHALVIFLGVKMLLLGLLALSGFAASMLRGFPLMQCVLIATVAGSIGMYLPDLWLNKQKRNRQILLRRGLPDALDMIVICLRGGLSLQGAFQRVVQDLSMAHPGLALEFSINLREIQLGRSTGEAMRHFSDRCDLEEIRSLSSVILQAERLGASTVNALRVHADTLRLKRLQRAEEMAGKAATKMVFPTILCIFPAILLVVIGPAVFQIMDRFSDMK
jgi:tight adherence protein C